MVPYKGEIETEEKEFFAMYKINVEKRAKSLQSKQRNKILKNLLLEVYGSFEEMALCGVQGFGRTGYRVPLSPYKEHLLGDKDEYGESHTETDIDTLKVYIAENKLYKKHIYMSL